MKHAVIGAMSLLVGSLLLWASPAAAFPKGVPGQECTTAQLQTPGATRCINRGANEIGKGVDPAFSHFVVCLANGTRACCAQQSDGGYSCGYITDFTIGGSTGGSGQATVGGSVSPEQSYTPPSATFHLSPGQKQP